MRRIVFCLLSGVLLALVTARALLPESARAATADGETYGYNISGVSLPITTETAGSALIADMNGYYLFRTPTAKNEWTGALAGKDLIVICADAWRAPASPSRYGESALYRLSRGSARLGDVYATDWYQGADGLAFALLTGVIPTTVDGKTALTYTAEQHILLPYALARCLSEQGYICAAFIRDEAQRAGLEALGFDSVTAAAGASAEIVAGQIADIAAEDRFFAYLAWPEKDGEAALEALFSALKSAHRSDTTAICLLAGAQEDGRASLYIYSPGLGSAVSRRPCSALDVTPTLLNLFGLEYDSRFLSGLDLFSTNGETGEVRAVTPVVSLYGSAFSDWVSDAGYYSSAGSIFRQTADCFETSADVSAYVHDVSRLVYDRYIYTRKAMEYNYFQVALGAPDAAGAG